ncbi:MAG: hypothetical protein IKP58_01585 [Victivallales bacterium]|nr:hypothetical protein [Victivallales bacterium]
MNKDVTATLVWRRRWCGGGVPAVARRPCLRNLPRRRDASDMSYFRRR